jgi:hypothetical protein
VPLEHPGELSGAGILRCAQNDNLRAKAIESKAIESKAIGMQEPSELL